MATVGDNTIILNVPPTGQAVCVLFRDKNGHVISQHVIFPPNCETGYHEANSSYRITALTDVKLERLDAKGQYIDTLTLKQGETFDRDQKEAKHNVCNRGDDFVVMMK